MRGKSTNKSKGNKKKDKEEWKKKTHPSPFCLFLSSSTLLPFFLPLSHHQHPSNLSLSIIFLTFSFLCLPFSYSSSHHISLSSSHSSILAPFSPLPPITLSIFSHSTLPLWTSPLLFNLSLFSYFHRLFFSLSQFHSFSPANFYLVSSFFHSLLIIYLLNLPFIIFLY